MQYVSGYNSYRSYQDMGACAEERSEDGIDREVGLCLLGMTKHG